MKEKIIEKACELFLKFGFKSVTMDDIAGEMCISKKTIYKYFCNKEILVKETTIVVRDQINEIIQKIISENHNAIKENFEIRKIFKEMFKSSDDSSVFQLKKHYPEIYQNIFKSEIQKHKKIFSDNINKGIKEGLYRKDLNINNYVDFYYYLIFNIHEDTTSEIDCQKIELEALEYHTRAMATSKGIKELESHLYSIYQ
ncbi:TetR/AcrR family transcriptional regulator [Flavobacterium haoranii]|uniref:Transcriptional regulator, TetR family n=1 Tax=Flavobacterium haoranii TaxID=683124 RepID=A0A1M6F8Q7_9FLAO|nr:TetR/AcrR family transcriptional regulator [Flavobacterium haoranii]SHI94052.1 transcriptional regulator, TetR family [Flavobacterium haoranii]